MAAKVKSQTTVILRSYWKRVSGSVAPQIQGYLFSMISRNSDIDLPDWLMYPQYG